MPRLSNKVPPESLLEDLNTALLTILTNTTTETTKLMYATAHTILEMLGYRMISINKEQCHPWKRRLKEKFKATWREVSQLSELQIGGKERETTAQEVQQATYNRGTRDCQTKTHGPGKPGCLLSPGERYTREVEARRINKMFSTNPSKVYSQWQGGKTTADPSRAETEQCWKNIWEEATHNTNAQGLVDLRAEHSNLPEQDPDI